MISNSVCGTVTVTGESEESDELAAGVDDSPAVLGAFAGSAAANSEAVRLADRTGFTAPDCVLWALHAIGMATASTNVVIHRLLFIRPLYFSFKLDIGLPR
jgi:hypothetical protein